jgi:hypothetical protein
MCDTAWCCSCRQWLPYSAFRPSARYRNGCEAACRGCHARMNKEWRERNPDVVEAYNRSRRIGPRERDCVDCGSAFTAGLRGPASDRCHDCRRERKIEQRRALRATP